jgi:hypothetical protein
MWLAWPRLVFVVDQLLAFNFHLSAKAIAQMPEPSFFAYCSLGYSVA